MAILHIGPVPPPVHYDRSLPKQKTSATASSARLAEALEYPSEVVRMTPMKLVMTASTNASADNPTSAFDKLSTCASFAVGRFWECAGYIASFRAKSPDKRHVVADNGRKCLRLRLASRPCCGLFRDW